MTDMDVHSHYRFFAVSELKTLLEFLILNYDFEFAEEGLSGNSRSIVAEPPLTCRLFWIQAFTFSCAESSGR